MQCWLANMNQKELWRIRLNWIFIILVNPLYNTSLIGPASSFHQFITNPTLEELQVKNKLQNGTLQMEPGLGQSELIYTFLNSATNLGAMIGGILAGFLVRCVPYWYLWLFTLLSQVFGNILYSIGDRVWIIMIARILVGYFAGASLTLSLSYVSASSETYTKVKKDVKDVNKDDVAQLRSIVLSIVSFTFTAGFAIGPGMAVVFAQFKTVSQFRSIGWFNVAYGVASLVLLMILFRGESNIHIVITVVILFAIEMFRFTYLFTLFGPVASDSLGLDERDSSYILLALGLVQIGSSILLIILRRLKFQTQSIIIFGLLMTITGYLLLGDWQSIPYDPCTEFSPFHHPNLTDSLNASKFAPAVNEQLPTHLMQGHLTTQMKMTLSDVFATTLETPLYATELNCQEVSRSVHSCDTELIFDYSNTNGALEHNSRVMKCILNHFPSVTVCIRFVKKKTPNKHRRSNSSNALAHIESIQVVSDDIYWIARNNCMNADIPGRNCHWIPSSLVTKKECRDCPLICRSSSQTFTFTQFCIGLILLLLSNPFVFFPSSELVFNQVHYDYQGMIMGFITTVNSMTRIITPFILDISYEGMQKRTYLIMLVLVLLHTPFLIEVAVLYHKLGPSANPLGKKLKTLQ